MYDLPMKKIRKKLFLVSLPIIGMLLFGLLIICVFLENPKGDGAIAAFFFGVFIAFTSSLILFLPIQAFAKLKALYKNGRLVKNCPVIMRIQKSMGVENYVASFQYNKEKEPLWEPKYCLNYTLEHFHLLATASVMEGDKRDIIFDETTGNFLYDLNINRLEGNREDDFYRE